ncbi:P-loop containing nucleoside triphosphate hydrolase protein [Aulographum hederae CBS 113979]|uniref:Origin recognition complex subunit 4 n=1 Tax=Aulographum hederae CBS 113979 TaxID=1176131 RepID=A0A6G1GP60_9PEZI|nr:P-loop containing nucleoside triphosphate hydrolase protein [Aulographum hederae CBS 113979]
MSTPRSSKRRKTFNADDTSTPAKNNTGTPYAWNGSLRKLPRRNNNVVLNGHDTQPGADNVQESDLEKDTTEPNSAKRRRVDVYDDIDGAFGPDRTSERKRRRTGGLQETEEVGLTAPPKKKPRGRKSAIEGEEAEQMPKGKSPRNAGPQMKVPTASKQLSARRSKRNTVETVSPLSDRESGEEVGIESGDIPHASRMPPDDSTPEDFDMDESPPPQVRPTKPSIQTPRSRRTMNRTDHAGNSLEDLATQDHSNTIEDTTPYPGARSWLQKLISLRSPGNGKKTEKEKQVALVEDFLPVELEEQSESMDIDQATDSNSPDEQASFFLLKKVVLEKLTARRPIPLTGLEDECGKVRSLVKQTVSAGEGNSMLVIGARGSGKSTLVNEVIRDLSKEHKANFHVIRLNGFIHTDDKIALRDIWRQLGREMEIEEDGTGKSYADTLAKLLALLAHPSEISGQESDEVAKSVIFVMDEFDLFTTHPRQTLLYNLFDIAQSRKAPIAVLGLTTRIDVAESLEKRVKSRFSHRYVHISLPKSLHLFQEICKAALGVTPEELDKDELDRVSAVPELTDGTSKSNKSATQGKDVLTAWNDAVQSLFSNEIFLDKTLAPHYYTTKSLSAAFSSLVLPLAKVNDSSSLIKTFTTSHNPSTTLAPPPSSLSLLPSLSDLSLSLLIATARLDILHDADTANLSLAYAEYTSLVSKARLQTQAAGVNVTGAGMRVFGKNVARGAWEGLVDIGLLIPVMGGVNGGGMVRCDVSLEEIGEVIRGMGVGGQMERWCRQL